MRTGGSTPQLSESSCLTIMSGSRCLGATCSLLQTATDMENCVTDPRQGLLSMLKLSCCHISGQPKAYSGLAGDKGMYYTG